MCHKKEDAIFNWPDCLVIFGCTFSADININDNCNTNTESLSDFGDYYTLPDGIDEDSDEAYSYLAGAHEFKVEEIEVYSVKFI